MGRLRLDQLLESASESAVYLADDEVNSDLILVVLASSREELDPRLSEFGPASRCTEVDGCFVAELLLEERHLSRFGEKLLRGAKDRVVSVPAQAPRGPGLLAGTRIAGRYVVDALLGRGGMADVYRAHDPVLCRNVAVKLLHFEGLVGRSGGAHAHAKSRLLEEARFVAALRHPHIVEVFDAGEADGIPYLVAELCEQGNLREAMDLGKASDKEKLAWLRQVADALAYAHARNIAHLDVKPENVLLTAGGLTKLADFGIAKAFSDDVIQASTTCIIGTPRYMAPEQLYCGAVDARADQFSWGILAAELWTGVHPRDAEREASRTRRPPRQIPPAIRAVVDKACASSPDARFLTMADVSSALAGAEVDAPRRLWGGGGREPAAPPAASERRARRRRQFAAGTALAATGLLAFIGGYLEHGTGHPTLPANHFEGIRAEAVSAYSAALQLWRDASTGEALQKLHDATALDPAFAEAHLKYALFSPISAAAREHFHEAAQFRRRLSPDDLEILHALEPSLREPFDAAATRDRLLSILRARPTDVELLLSVAGRFLDAWDGADALPLAESAARASKEPVAIVSLYRARSLAKLGRFDEARAEYENCLGNSPSATECLNWLARIDANNDGRCDSVETLGRRLSAIDHEAAEGHEWVAGALFAKTQSVRAARSALDPWWATRTLGDGIWQRNRDETYLNVLAGDFAATERSLDAWEKAGASFPDADHRGEPAAFRLLLGLELGRKAEVQDLAHRYLDESLGWSEGNRIVFDIEGLRALYLSGEATKSDFDGLRNEWLGRAQQRQRGDVDPFLFTWYEAYVEPVRDADDARLALLKRPKELATFDQELLTAQANQKFGFLFTMSGDYDIARQYLKKAASACTFNRPLHQTVAMFEYGQMLARSGDTQGACKEYATVVRRWGKEPRSGTAAAAREDSTRLGCPSLESTDAQ